jgi:caffeoyl-CoA O-methyltransferase
MESLADGESCANFDFIFIDADKKNYPHYYEKGLELLRVGGVIMLDNVLWDGKVANNHIKDESTVAIRDLNKKIASDPRVSQVLLPMADGITLAQKIKPIF